MNKNLPKDWLSKSLGEISTFRRGSFPQPYGNPEWYSDNGFPFVQVYDIGNNNQLKSKTKSRISHTAANQSVFIKKGSLIVSIQGSIGRVAITQYDAYVDRTILIFSDFEEFLDKKFFVLIIKELFLKQASIADGGVIKTITKDTLKNFLINFPPLQEQKKIADIISQIDDLIAFLVNKEEKNKYLALGVAERIFETSHESKKLSEITTVITKGTTPTSLGMHFVEKGINFIKVESIIEDGLIDKKKFSYISQDTHDSLKRSQILSGDILFTIAGATVGKLALAEEEILPANTNQALAIIRVNKEKLRPQFLYQWLKTRIIKNIVDKHQTVGAQPNVSLSQIGEFPVPFISLQMQDQIYQQLDSIDNVISSIRKKILHLKFIRKSLMSDLITGSKRVNI